MDSHNSASKIRERTLPEHPMLSVIVATVKDWQDIREYMKPLLRQAELLDVELVIADGKGQPLPDQIPSNAVWLSEPGSSLFRLRALGVQNAKGRFVALTEDHCTVSPGWGEQIINAHRNYPDIDVISGVVENGSRDTICNRIHFLMGKGPFMSPVTSRDSHLISGEANISFKKHVVPKDMAEIGFPFYQSFKKQGYKTMIHGDIVVWHIQSLSFIETCEIHFHNGKSIAGLRLSQLSIFMRILRILSSVLLPGVLTARTFATVFQKRRERMVLLMGFPLLITLSCCHAVGEFLGYLVGAGDSPYMIN